MVRASRVVPKPFEPKDLTPLTMQPCASVQTQQFSVGAKDGTIRLTGAMSKCVDLLKCDTGKGIVDIYTCHAAGDKGCPGSTATAPTNQLFTVNANGTIAYTSSPLHCLGSTPIGSAGVSAVQLQKCTGAANQLWQLNSAGASHLIQQRGGDHCVSV